MVLCHKELYIQGYTIYTKKCSFTEVCILKQNLHEKLTESQTNSGATAWLCWTCLCIRDWYFRKLIQTNYCCNEYKSDSP